jgi:hypothetical protein
MKTSVKLDPARLLGLRLERGSMPGAKLGAKLGQKLGPKLGFKTGPKLGFKAAPLSAG